jgi:2,3-bisphosphoglycerate-independent phosphoglycerate mutase
MKYVVFLGDGMADEPIEELGGKTPLQVADTPNIDHLASSGHARMGTFRSLPDKFPTSSDVANLSVLGFDLEKVYEGRGPLEAASQGIILQPDEIAMRMNLVHTSDDGKLMDYSGGQISSEEATQLVDALQESFGSDTLRFEKGVAYRNLLILKGEQFSASFQYEKPDDHPGDPYADLLPKGRDEKSEATAAMLRLLTLNSLNFLDEHPVNQKRRAEGKLAANMAWFWSPGKKPLMPPFREVYQKTGAIISAVDVIKGIGQLADMTVIDVPGATGYIDTDYEAKARAGVNTLEDHDFVYVHVEGIDEVSHAGERALKLKAIEDFDKRLIGTFLETFADSPVAEGKGLDNLSIAVLPDHPVPLALRKHTRIPVPVMIVQPGQQGDGLLYNESDALKGTLGLLQKDGVMRTLFGK